MSATSLVARGENSLAFVCGYERRRRAVYVSSLNIAAADGSPPPAAGLLETANRGGPNDLVWSQDEIVASARWEDDPDAQTRHLYAACAVDGRVLLLTISDELDAPREWAEAVEHSVRWASPVE